MVVRLVLPPLQVCRATVPLEYPFRLLLLAGGSVLPLPQKSERRERPLERPDRLLLSNAPRRGPRWFTLVKVEIGRQANIMLVLLN